MGYMRHHAIIVTSWDEELLKKAHDKAVTIFNQVAPITPTDINGYVSFMVAPDGSKEGWAESEMGDDKRNELTEWIESQRYSDGSMSIDYVEIQFGDDNGVTKIIRHNG